MVKEKTAALERVKKAAAKAKGRAPSRGGPSSRSKLPQGWVQGDWIRSTITEKDLADPWGISPSLARSARSFSAMVERIQSPWTQPCGSLGREEEPPRLGALPFTFAAAFFTRSRAAVFSFTMVAGEASTELRRWKDEERGEKVWRRREEKSEVALFKMPCPTLYMEPLPSG